MMGFFPSINTFPSLVAQAVILSCYKKRTPYAQNVFAKSLVSSNKLFQGHLVFLEYWE